MLLTQILSETSLFQFVQLTTGSNTVFTTSKQVFVKIEIEIAINMSNNAKIRTTKNRYHSAMHTEININKNDE